MKGDDILCVRCLVTLKPIVSQSLKITKSLTVPVFSLTAYEGPIKSLILAKASSNILASKQLATLIWRYSLLKHQQFDVIVPVPLHWSRYAYRGYNQAAVIAQHLSKLSGKSHANLLQRTVRTPLLSSLPIAQRYDTVKGAFTLYGDYSHYKGKHILLVDDVMTTGSTLIAACKQLNKIKPASIQVVVGARIV